MNKRINSNFNQQSLPFGESKARAITLEDRQRVFWFLAGASALSIFIYIYAVNATAHHLAVRQNLESEVSEMSSEISRLEFEAIALRNDVTIDTARQLGFTEVKEPLYVSRTSAGSLTLNTVTR
jgi:hypothetical protein